SYACSHTPTLSAFSFFFSSSGHHPHLHSFPTRRSSDLAIPLESGVLGRVVGPPEMDGLIQRNRAKRVGSLQPEPLIDGDDVREIDRKSTRLNSSHVAISYAVFCLKKKKRQTCARMLYIE